MVFSEIDSDISPESGKVGVSRLWTVSCCATCTRYYSTRGKECSRVSLIIGRRLPVKVHGVIKAAYSFVKYPGSVKRSVFCNIGLLTYELLSRFH